jgi:hypothetical protein
MMDTLLGFVVIAGAVQPSPIVNVPLPVEASPVRAGLAALTVNAVVPAGVPAVVVMVSAEVFEASPARKLTVAGLNEAVAPAGSDEVTLRAALKAVPVAPFRATVTV